ncbi:MAG: hypothetical protein ACPG7F_07810 [Aggregatilineales bacterium]
MLNTPIRAVFDVITDFLATSPSQQEILAYAIPDDLQARVEWLLERNGEGELSRNEERELMDFVCADDMMSLLKIKIQIRMQGTNKYPS